MNEQPNQHQTEKAEVVRLPLWKNVLDQMRAGGIAHGQTFETKWFEEKLRLDRDTMAFGLSISEIRRALEFDGFYLCGRGTKGESFVILPPAANQRVMESYAHEALDAMKRGVILGTNTRLDMLTALERQRHEKYLEKMAFRLQCVKHSESIRKMAGKDAAVAKKLGV